MLRRERSTTRLQFAVAILLFAGWFAPNFLATWREVAVARQIRRLGGDVRFHVEWTFPHVRIGAVRFRGERADRARLNQAADLLSQTTGVRRLAFLGMDCDAETLRRFSDHRGLRRLYLRGCREISDEALAVVARWRRLQVLDLGETQVTDAGLRHLTELKALRRLNLPGRQEHRRDEPHWVFALRCQLIESWGPPIAVTRRGVEALARALPGCEIRQVA